MSLYSGLKYMVETKGEGDSFHAWALQEIDALQARVKDQAETIIAQKAVYEVLSGKVKELEQQLSVAFKAEDAKADYARELLKENARMKAVVDAVRKHCPVIQLREDQPIGKALRELDGEKSVLTKLPNESLKRLIED